MTANLETFSFRLFCQPIVVIRAAVEMGASQQCAFRRQLAHALLIVLLIEVVARRVLCVIVRLRQAAAAAAAEEAKKKEKKKKKKKRSVSDQGR